MAGNFSTFLDIYLIVRAGPMLNWIYNGPTENRVHKGMAGIIFIEILMLGRIFIQN